MKSQADYSSTEFYEFVEQALHDLERYLYCMKKEGRQAVYKTLLGNICYMLLIDGGPTFGLEVLEEACADLRRWEEQRGCKKLGPFLSKAQREVLLKTPGRYMRQDIDFTGPSRWQVTDGY